MSWDQQWQRTRTLGLGVKTTCFLSGSESPDPFLSCFIKSNNTPLHVPFPENSSSLNTFLRCIPEALGNWRGGVEDRRSNPSKEWNASILGLRNFGVHGEYHQCRYLQGVLQKDRELQGTKGERKLKTESECKRVGGITLSLLPNLASESSTAGRGGGRGLWVRLTYPAPGCWRLILGWTGQLKGWV